MILKIFASRAAAEFARMKSDHAREAELVRLSLLQRISRAISKSLEPGKVLSLAAEEVGRVFEVPCCQICSVEGRALKLAAEYVSAPSSSMNRTVEFPGDIEELLDLDSEEKTGACIAIRDVFIDDRLNPIHDTLGKSGTRSLIVAATSFEDKANGIVILQQEVPRDWNQAEMDLLEAIAAQIGVAIAQAEFSERESRQRREIEQSRRKAEAASRAKGEFLARMSHELRTPMNAILGFSQLLTADNNLNADQQNTLAIINRSGEHLMALINDVLEMSKIEAGKLEINRSVFDPEILLYSIADLFRIRAETKGLELKVQLSNDLSPLLNTDESKLRQILTNLLGNAIKFTERGSVSLEAKSIPAPGRGIEFRVQDTGIGIAREEQERLFSPFMQTESGIASGQGTGLGLAITKAFVELLGGTISVESCPGRGSIFSFSVPCLGDATVKTSSNLVDRKVKASDGTGTARRMFWWRTTSRRIDCWWFGC